MTVKKFLSNMNKDKIAIISSTALGLLIFVIILYNGIFKKEVPSENNNKLRSGSSISMMLETKPYSGEYKQSDDTKWPTEGYIFNETLSKCENGSKLIWNEDTHSIRLTTNITDKCYVYFDVEPPDIYIAANNLPTTYGKLGAIDCTDGTATYNQKYNRIEVSQVSSKYTNCTLNYTDSTSKVNLASYITSLAGTTQGTGEVVNENGYRYEGKNPNNYVWFNNEYWRIIGVFDSNTHGQSGKNLVKIIRAETLAGLVWDKSNTNDWTTASLNLLLNGAYYNATDGTNSGYCYGFSATVTGNCDYTKRGIQSGYRSMIANVTWYLGGYSSSGATTEAFYGYERGTTVYGERPTSTTGYIGLMYPSDYGYSALSSSCTSSCTNDLTSYSSSYCVSANWLYGKGDEWTLSPNSSKSNYVFHLSHFGNLNNIFATHSYGVRPVLYLDSSVYKIDGDGSLDNPYIIGM